MTDIVDRLNGNAPSIMAMRDGAEEIMRLRRELFAARNRLAEFENKSGDGRLERVSRIVLEWMDRTILGCEEADGFVMEDVADMLRAALDPELHKPRTNEEA